ncbi:BTAD domain-containing putative transcriptional regulator [Actinokineospora sp. HUAS TT18]|uniref:AfsR/SARP family transcriptional regulator n=1 Tax=Actinokineospora sp. HUAS TT18 TaxID=3447451 RepID=UPI003F5273D8
MKYRILGPLEVVSAGGLPEPSGERQQKLLALLLVNANSVVSFTRLVDELWDDPPQTAKRQVYNSAAALRRVLADDLATSTVGYQLDVAPGDLDADVFRADVAAAETAAAEGRTMDAVRLLQRALAVWRGPALDGLDTAMLCRAADGLREERLIATERLARLRLDLGEVGSLLGDLAPLVAEHPLRESLRATLMMALCRAGRSADALTVFEDGRKVLAEELGADPGVELRRLHGKILRGDDRPKPASGSFLPYDCSDFTGRKSEIRRLVAAIAEVPDRAPAIVAIDGMGGVGKTTLALHVAHQLASAYPDGQYFVDLRGFTLDDERVAPAVALEALLGQVGVAPEAIPTSLDARRDLWRSKIAGQRVVVVLDNAADAAHVRPLLPGAPGSVAIITSRRQLLALEGAVPLSLAALPAADAGELFTLIAGPRRVEAEAAARAEVVELCGRLPLAIRIAASRLRHRPGWTVSHLADQLRDTCRRARTLTVDDRSVAGVLGWSYQHLSPVQQRVFRLLSLAPGPDIDAYAAAAVADLPLADAEQALEDLVDCNLLDQRTANRYLMHDLLKDCGRALAESADTAADLTAARGRLFDYYLHLADVCCRPLTMGRQRFEPELRYQPAAVPVSTSATDDVDRLNLEHRNMVAVAQFAATHDWPGHAWQLPCLLTPYFVQLGYRADSLELFDGALRATRQVGHRRGESIALASMARAKREHGGHSEVMALLGQAIAISADLGDDMLLAAQKSDLGEIQFRAGLLRDAGANFADARDLALRAGDVESQVNFTLNLGVIQCNLGDFTAALESFALAQAHYQRTNRTTGEVVALINIGWVSHAKDNDEAAADHLRRAVALSRGIGFTRGEGLALAWLGVALRCLGHIKEAIETGSAAVTVVHLAGMREAECDAMIGLAETYFAAGKPDLAHNTVTAAHKMALDGDLSLAEARAEECLAHLAAAEGDHTGAHDHWHRAMKLYPAESAEAENPRVHLTTPEATCQRCRSRR